MAILQQQSRWQLTSPAAVGEVQASLLSGIQDVGVLTALDGLCAGGGLQSHLVGRGSHTRADHAADGGLAHTGAGNAGSRGTHGQGHCDWMDSGE